MVFAQVGDSIYEAMDCHIKPKWRLAKRNAFVIGPAPSQVRSCGIAAVVGFWRGRRIAKRPASLKEMRMWSGYSVDRRGFSWPDGELGLWPKDPMKSPFWCVPGRFEKKELEDHLLELFPEGLSVHAWQYLPHLHDFRTNTVANDGFANQTWQVERTLEMVRRAALPKMNSHLQSYFASETLDTARNFRNDAQAIYRTQSGNGFRADQNWLSLGAQG